MKDLKDAINEVFMSIGNFIVFGWKLLVIAFFLLWLEFLFKRVAYMLISGMQEAGIISSAMAVNYQKIGDTFLDVLGFGFILWYFLVFKKRKR